MLQKFGTALSKEEMKMVKGGENTQDVEGDGGASCPLKCSDVGCSSVTNNCVCNYQGTPNEYCGEHR